MTWRTLGESDVGDQALAAATDSIMRYVCADLCIVSHPLGAECIWLITSTTPQHALLMCYLDSPVKTLGVHCGRAIHVCRSSL